MEQQRISADDLAMRLVNSRKIMKKVDSGDYEKGNINEELLTSIEPVGGDSDDVHPQVQEKASPVRSIPPPNAQKINQSKLPDAIKRAMIENPIPQITLNDSLDMDVAAKARKLMEQDGSYPKSGKQGSAPAAIPNKTNLNSNELATLIEGIVRKVLDEKLTQILTAQQVGTINENLAIKVGDSIFSGKITKVKSTK